MPLLNTIWRQTLWLTLALELITLLSRFGLQLESTRDTAFIANFTFGLRIHHGYIGILLALIAYLLLERGSETSTKNTYRWFMVVGLALFFSDMVHHFIVLWPLTGSPQFDLMYPVL